MTLDDLHGLAQAIAWCEGTDDWREPSQQYLDAAHQFLGDLHGA